MRDLVLYPDSRLKKLCAVIHDVTSDFCFELAGELHARTMERDANGPGLGMSAPQLGENVQMFVMRYFTLPFINPEIVKFSTETGEMTEGCLSIPEVRVTITRPADVVVRAQTLDGSVKDYVLRGIAARVAQHEIDHLNGVLILDHALRYAEAKRIDEELEELHAR